LAEPPESLSDDLDKSLTMLDIGEDSMDAAIFLGGCSSISQMFTFEVSRTNDRILSSLLDVDELDRGQMKHDVSNRCSSTSASIDFSQEVEMQSLGDFRRPTEGQGAFGDKYLDQSIVLRYRLDVTFVAVDRPVCEQTALRLIEPKGTRRPLGVRLNRHTATAFYIASTSISESMSTKFAAFVRGRAFGISKSKSKRAAA